MNNHKKKKEAELDEVLKEEEIANNDETLEEGQINEIDLLKEQLNLANDKALRANAELINYKKRKDEETHKIMKYANADLLLDIVGTIDNFESAIKMDNENLDDEVSKFLEGFKMIYSHMADILTKHEVVEIDCLDKEFDATHSQAMMTKSIESKEDNIVLEVYQKGYMYKDRLLRPAMVVVNKIDDKEGNDNNE